MKKRIFSILLICSFMLLLAGCNKTTNDDNQPTQTPVGRFTPGTYVGKANGYGGEITATVVLSADKIDSITVDGPNETQGVGSVAVDTMPAAMVEQQTVNVDMVSGATRSSTAIIEAVTAALTSAGVDVNTLGSEGNSSENTAPVTEENLSCDVVVIGAGGAGMTAAIHASEAGLNVLILEKQAIAGGNTSYATGGMNAAGTELQKQNGVDDSVDSFVEDTLKGGNYTNNESLVRILGERSADAVNWLKDLGAPLESLTFSGGATNKRMHAPKDGSAVGPYLVSALMTRIEEDGIQILYNTKAVEILTTDKVVTGVKAQGQNVNYTISCNAVILATGGFGANAEMVTEYNPSLEGFTTTNSAGATGDGILMAAAVGANLIDMEQIQVHPTVEYETSKLITESVRGRGAILVNTEGKRFINELDTRNVVSQAIMEQPNGYAYLIFDQQVRDGLAAIEDYIAVDLVYTQENLNDLAAEIGVSETNLNQTVADWNACILENNNDIYNRTTGMDQPLSTGPYYAIKVAPAIHHTMGGVQIDTTAQVIDTAGNVIPGLFAAGEVTGGVHGENRVGGNAVLEVVVFGKIAGQSAAAYVNAQ